MGKSGRKFDLGGLMQVAAACQVSAPKLARLKVIREKLKAPEFLLLFEKDRLAEQAEKSVETPASRRWNSSGRRAMV